MALVVWPVLLNVLGWSAEILKAECRRGLVLCVVALWANSLPLWRVLSVSEGKMVILLAVRLLAFWRFRGLEVLLAVKKTILRIAFSGSSLENGAMFLVWRLAARIVGIILIGEELAQVPRRRLS